MNKLFINIIISIFAITIFYSCEPVKIDDPVIDSKNKTVLIYMEANNNLSSDANNNIKLMLNGHLPDKDGDNLIIYLHSYNSNPKLLKLYKENNIGKMDTVYHFPDINSATTTALKNAMNLTNTMFPAKEKGLILWSHGTGWLPEGYYLNSTQSQTLRSFTNYVSPWPAPPGGIDPYAHLVKSFGSQKRASDSKINEIEIPDLAKALPYKVDFIIFDACLMGNIEVAYELKDSVNHILFSPAEVLTNGLEYSNMMRYLLATPTDLEGVAKNAYDYYNSQSGQSKSLTISLVETSKLKNVADAAKNVFDLYKDRIESIDVSKIQPYFRYNKYWYYDINDFITQLCGEDGKEHASNFTKALDNAIIYKATTGRIINLIIDPNKYSGISTYIPYHPNDNTLNTFYKKYKWNSDVQMINDTDQ